MKRILLAAITMALVLCLTACGLNATASDKTAEALGTYKSKEIHTYAEGTTVEYGKYFYDEADPLDVKAFTRALSSDISTVQPYINDFEARLQKLGSGNEVAKAYDYDYSAMEKGDFFYITDRDGKAPEKHTYSYYTLYIFDRLDNVLYYFHVES